MLSTVARHQFGTEHATSGVSERGLCRLVSCLSERPESRFTIIEVAETRSVWHVKYVRIGHFPEKKQESLSTKNGVSIRIFEWLKRLVLPLRIASGCKHKDALQILSILFVPPLGIEGIVERYPRPAAAAKRRRSAEVVNLDAHLLRRRRAKGYGSHSAYYRPRAMLKTEGAL